MRVAHRPRTTGTEARGRGHAAKDSAAIGESSKGAETKGPMRSQGGRGKLVIPKAFGN